jgi:sigma-B regulation protein RsbU (phosphoserine phosphatase)
VGDASGKGMPAALLMAVSLASFQSAIDLGLEPAELLAHLDEVIMPYTRTGRQNCVFCYVEVLLSGGGTSDTAMLRAANAGCVPPLIRRQNGAIEWVEVGGMPLGVGLGAEDGYPEATISLRPGDLVILTSDGVIEAMSASKEMFGFERLEEAVATGPTTSAEAMSGHLRAAVASFTGNAEPHDDLTIVVGQV